MEEESTAGQRLRRHRWALIGLNALVLTGVEVGHYIAREVSLEQAVVGWLIRLVVMLVLLEIGFWILVRAQGRFQNAMSQWVQAEQVLKQRNRELSLLNRVSREFAATLDLDQVLIAVLDEVRRLLDVSASSIWLVDSGKDELVCLQSTGSHSERVRGWRLAIGEGLAGWVAHSGESLIVPDAQADGRHFGEVDRHTGVALRSVLSVPMKVNENVTGVIQVLDTGVDRFQPSALELVESLAAAAAIAVENARLYEDSDRLRAFNENIVRSMEEGILLEDPAGFIAFVNPKVTDLLGYQPDELIGKHCQTLTPPEETEKVEKETAKRSKGLASRYEVNLLAKGGERVPSIVSARPLFEEDRFIGVLSVFTDITERVLAEEALRESEERHRSLFERIPVGLYRTAPSGEILDANPALLQMLGYEDRQALLTARATNVFIDPEDRRREQILLKRDGIVRGFETQIRRRDGSTMWARDTARAVLNADGEVLYYEGSLEDITASRRAEEEKRELEDKLERARRMESLGVLAGGIAHDLNNILGPVVAYPDLILEELPEDDPVREDVLEIKRAADGAAAEVQDLLALARRGIYRMMPVNLGTVIEDYIRSPSFVQAKATNPEVLVDVNVAAGPPSILGSVPHLAKVAMNLVINAFEAMPQGGNLTISVSAESLDRLVSGYELIPAGDYVVLRVGDTGTGIEQADLYRIFEPFYTKKEMGRSGSGLGLAVVHGVVRDHKGMIDLRSEVGKGTEFAIYFPITGKAIVEDDEDASEYRGDETVLVVDDLPVQREVASRLLSSLGYQVASVESGRAAVAYLTAHEVDILVLDMILEDDFDGLDAYQQIIQFRAGQKAVLASGSGETERAKDAQCLGAGQFVKKPYTLKRLGKAVRQELDGIRPSDPAAPDANQ